MREQRRARAKDLYRVRAKFAAANRCTWNPGRVGRTRGGLSRGYSAPNFHVRACRQRLPGYASPHSQALRFHCTDYPAHDNHGLVEERTERRSSNKDGAGQRRSIRHHASRLR